MSDLVMMIMVLLLTNVQDSLEGNLANERGEPFSPCQLDKVREGSSSSFVHLVLGSRGGVKKTLGLEFVDIDALFLQETDLSVSSLSSNAV